MTLTPSTLNPVLPKSYTSFVAQDPYPLNLICGPRPLAIQAVHCILALLMLGCNGRKTQP